MCCMERYGDGVEMVWYVVQTHYTRILIWCTVDRNISRFERLQQNTPWKHRKKEITQTIGSIRY